MNVDAQWRADITRQMEVSAKAQQDTALALERILGRLDGVEKWQQAEERAKERAEARRDERDDQRPDQQRANLAIAISAIMAAIYLLTLLSAHWKP